MTQDRWRRIARTAIQAGIPALILWVTSLSEALPGVLEGGNLAIATAALTAIVSALHNYGDSQLDRRRGEGE